MHHGVFILDGGNITQSERYVENWKLLDKTCEICEKYCQVNGRRKNDVVTK